eukprot:7254076-Pyramimonas_sp.AAC.1
MNFALVSCDNVGRARICERQCRQTLVEEPFSPHSAAARWSAACHSGSGRIVELCRPPSAHRDTCGSW